jgi:hypothetical protein
MLEEQSYLSLELVKVDSFKDMGSSAKLMASAMMKKNKLNEIKNHELAFAQRHSALMSEAKMYKTLGMRDKVIEVMKRVESMTKEHEDKTKELTDELQNPSPISELTTVQLQSVSDRAVGRKKDDDDSDIELIDGHNHDGPDEEEKDEESDDSDSNGNVDSDEEAGAGNDQDLDDLIAKELYS